MKQNSWISILLENEKGCQVAKLCTAVFVLLILLCLSHLLGGAAADWKLADLNEKQTQPQDYSLHKKNPLTQAHLFGYKVPDSSNLKLSQAPLRISGLVLQTEPSQISKALVSLEGGSAKVYTEGEMLPGDLKLLAIKRDGLVLEREGELEFLPLLRPRLEKR